MPPGGASHGQLRHDGKHLMAQMPKTIVYYVHANDCVAVQATCPMDDFKLLATSQ